VRRVVVVAKAPVPGLAKTRLAATVGAQGAAELAAAALLDTVDTANAWAPRRRLLSLHGSLSDGPMAPSIARATSAWHVAGQPEGGLGVRLAAALASAGRLWGSGPVLLIGMDTPQVTPDDLERLDRLRRRAGPTGIAIGPAEDGGWWGLAVSDPALGHALARVPMSTEKTCEFTVAALTEAGAVVRRGRLLRDMDTFEDATAIAAASPRLRTAHALGRVDATAAIR
jgi:glycosyltransferase A (GT-A) superfamily protein (DUF2064 family)